MQQQKMQLGESFETNDLVSGLRGEYGKFNVVLVQNGQQVSPIISVKNVPGHSITQIEATEDAYWQVTKVATLSPGESQRKGPGQEQESTGRTFRSSRSQAA